MPTFLDRYQAGGQVAVWRDLTALGEEVRHKKYLADAEAVAQETMRRARHNVETLIQRLDAAGYRFLTMEAQDLLGKEAKKRVWALVVEISEKMDQGDRRRFDYLRISRLPEYKKALTERAEQTRQATIEYLESALGPRKPAIKDAAVFAPPNKKTANQLEQLQKLAGGPLPLSLRAWYEQVGAVSLLGWHPSLNPSGDEPNAAVCPDPLMMGSLKSLIEEFKAQDLDEPAYVYLAPNDVTKAGSGGCGPYGMRVPDARADGIFAVVGSRKGSTFINYLRNVFKWGGFPGWDGKKGRPAKMIAQLTEGLLPI